MEDYYSIQFPSKGMCALWNHEFIGQFSDGHWENSPVNRGVRQYNARRWWNTKATTSSSTNMPPTSCPFSLPSFIKSITSYIKKGDIWPYRLIALYYSAEKFGGSISRRDAENLAITAAISTGVTYRYYYEDIPEKVMKNILPQELEFLEFLESLDFEQEWKKIIKITNQMQKIVQSYYK